MTKLPRNKMLSKLGHAIRRYRGTFDRVGKKWVEPPQPQALHDITIWLERLGESPEDVRESISTIQGFKNFKEFEAWIGSRT